MSRFLIITICLLLTLVIGFFAIYPKYQEITLLRNQIYNKSEEFKFREEYLKELSKASAELKNYDEQLKIIDATLPSEASLPLLFDFFQKAGSQSGMILKNISATKGSSPDNPKKVTISLEASGTYSSFKDFIVILENSARLINVNSVSFGKFNEEEQLIIFNFNLTASAFYYEQ
ncbi:type 4a pilus biogenesis protein PilO [Patescibacteria group bacterium]|nr:type 4a pilus biogenesis protein PilO [Patescibacteria group bacterium]MBU1877023.1 type 4a pilus biogenesis protein PilO [Patescibacteria group bacterium]